MPMTYPLDLSGNNPDNLIENELHQLNRPGKKAFVLDYGPFYARSLKVTDTVNNTVLKKRDQYIVTQLMVDNTLRTSQDICAIIIITDETLPDQLNLSVEYQVLGGPYSKALEPLTQLLDALDLNEFVYKWKEFIGSMVRYPPKPGLSDINSVYGFEYIVAALERLRNAVLMGDQEAFNEFYDYVRHQDDILMDGIDANMTALTNHINDHTDPHEVTKKQIGLGKADNTSDMDKPVTYAMQDVLDHKANLNDDVKFISVTANEFSSNILADSNPIDSGGLVFKDANGKLKFFEDPQLVKNWLDIQATKKVLANQITSISGKSFFTWDTNQLLQDTMNVNEVASDFDMSTVLAKALVRNVDPKSPLYTFYVNNQEVVETYISEDKTKVVVRNNDTHRHSFKVLITVNRKM